jgi:hypothetical protein
VLSLAKFSQSLLIILWCSHLPNYTTHYFMVLPFAKLGYHCFLFYCALIGQI